MYSGTSVQQKLVIFIVVYFISFDQDKFILVISITIALTFLAYSLYLIFSKYMPLLCTYSIAKQLRAAQNYTAIM